MKGIDRPLDFLSNAKGTEVCVYLKEGQLTGKLVAFDIHINLVIAVKDKPMFIRGDSIVKVEPLDP